MLKFLSNAFNDPSDPWYYIIGVLFLLAVFGAVAAYVIISGKKKSGESGGDEKDKSDSSQAEQQGKDEATENADTATKSQQDKE